MNHWLNVILSILPCPAIPLIDCPQGYKRINGSHCQGKSSHFVFPWGVILGLCSKPSLSLIQFYTKNSVNSKTRVVFRVQSADELIRQLIEITSTQSCFLHLNGSDWRLDELQSHHHTVHRFIDLIDKLEVMKTSIMLPLLSEGITSIQSDLT